VIGINEDAKTEGVMTAGIIDNKIFHLFHVYQIGCRSPGNGSAGADAHPGRNINRRELVVEGVDVKTRYFEGE
jgi:hypothetical protein